MNIKISVAEVENDFSEEEDIDSLSNCFVEFESTGIGVDPVTQYHRQF
jgi:hypothetical protein